MEILEAMIEEGTGKIRCPICGKTNGMVTRGAYVRGHKVRCKSSRRGHEHFFILNYGTPEGGDMDD